MSTRPSNALVKWGADATWTSGDGIGELVKVATLSEASAKQGHVGSLTFASQKTNFGMHNYYEYLDWFDKSFLHAEEFLADTDFVANALTYTTDPGLTQTLSPGVCYVNGNRLEFTQAILDDLSEDTHTFTASMDTFVLFDEAMTIHFLEVATGGAIPAHASSRQVMYRVVCDGSDVTSIEKIHPDVPVVKTDQVIWYNKALLGVPEQGDRAVFGTNGAYVLMRATSTTLANFVQYGGGTASHKAATDHEFYAAANTTTTTGTLIFAIDIDGIHAATIRDIGATYGDVKLEANFEQGSADDSGKSYRRTFNRLTTSDATDTLWSSTDLPTDSSRVYKVHLIGIDTDDAARSYATDFSVRVYRGGGSAFRVVYGQESSDGTGGGASATAIAVSNHIEIETTQDDEFTWEGWVEWSEVDF